MAQSWVDDSTLSGWLNIVPFPTLRMVCSMLGRALIVECPSQHWVPFSTLSTLLNIEYPSQHWVPSSMLGRLLHWVIHSTLTLHSSLSHTLNNILNIVIIQWLNILAIKLLHHFNSWHSWLAINVILLVKFILFCESRVSSNQTYYKRWFSKACL